MQTITRQRDPARAAVPVEDEQIVPPKRRSLWWRWAMIGAAVLIGGIGGLVIVLVVQSRDTSQQDAVEAVAAAHADVEAVARRLSHAERLADVHSAAGAADDAANHARDAMRTSSEIDDHRTRVASRDAVAADLSVLESLAALAELTPERLSEWEDKGPAIDGARAAVDRAAVPFEGLGLSDAPPSPSPVVGQARVHLDELISMAERRYGRWRHRFRKARRDRDADLAVIDGYAQTMRGHVGNYSSLRTQMSNWIEKVDSEGVTFAQAYDFLAEASAARSRVRAAIVSLDPPAAVSAQHNDLLATVDQAVDAVDAAYEGTVDFQFDFEGDYAYYREAPGWDTFKSESEQISARYSSAQGAWEGKLVGARKAVKDRRLPKEPAL